MPRKPTEKDPLDGKRVRLCVDTSKAKGPVVSNPNTVCEILRKEASHDRESMYAVHLDSANNVVGVEEIARGALGHVETTGREAFKGAILNNARSVIFAHNHPSGNPAPSDADKEMTRSLKEAGDLLGISVLDHITLTPNGCMSAMARGRVGDASVLGDPYSTTTKKPKRRKR